MSCTACGDKPKNTAKDFTKAVVEINNPESLVLLRKVVVPASIGDEEAFPPKLGKYRNVLLHYDVNGHNYLYSSDGIPTFLETPIPEEIYERITNLETGLASEEEARAEGDTALDNKITALDNSLAPVAKSGSYNDLTDTPYIPTQTSDLENDGADGTSTYVEASELAAVATSGDYDDLTNTPTIDSALSLSSDNAAQNSTISGALNNDVMTGVSVNANTSTTTVQLDGAKRNLYSGATTTDNIPLPVASTTQAGVMNSSTYDAVTSNTNNINAIMNGAVAITGITANPSQSDLTTAWQTETGLTALINRASIYDVTNNKVWTYYTNDTTWHAASNSSQVVINTFTNSSEGTILGSTNVGQIFAENDGTGSVNGWDTLSNNVSTNTSNIGSLQTAVAGKQDTLTPGTGISISAQNVISSTNPAPNDGTLTIQQNGTTLDTFTANSSLNKTVNVTAPEITMTEVDPGEGAPLAENNFIGVYGSDSIIMDYSTAEINTGAKWIDGKTIYKKTIDFGALPNNGTKYVPHDITNLGQMLRIEGIGNETTGTNPASFHIPHYSYTSGASIETYTNLGSVFITTGMDRSNTNGYITLYYTKSS